MLLLIIINNNSKSNEILIHSVIIISSISIIGVINFQEATPDEDRVVALRENLYVRVHGHVRSFQGKHHLMTFKIVPITNMNELTYHMLEVIHGHLALTKGVAGVSMTKCCCLLEISHEIDICDDVMKDQLPNILVSSRIIFTWFDCCIKGTI